MEINKPTILILHGWGSSSDSWVKVGEILKSQGYQVFRPDLPGFGLEAPPTTAWGIDDYLEWVNRFCLQNNLKQFFLLGHSFGGRVAIKFAVRYPEKLKGLILFSAAGVTPRPKFKLSLISILSKIGGGILSLPVLNLFKTAVRKTVYFVLGTRDYYFLSNETMRETFKKTIEEDLSSSLNQIKAKTLIVWGEKDYVTPLGDARRMNREIPNSLIKTIPDEGHNIHLKSPGKLSREIIWFLNSLKENDG